MNKRLQVIKYVAADILAAFIAWTLFFIYRKYAVNHEVFSQLNLIFGDRKLYYGVTIIPVFWLVLYTLIGTYRKIYRKARLREFAQTFLITIIGVTILFFTLILDDDVTLDDDEQEKHLATKCLNIDNRIETLVESMDGKKREEQLWKQ